MPFFLTHNKSYNFYPPLSHFDLRMLDKMFDVTFANCLCKILENVTVFVHVD